MEPQKFSWRARGRSFTYAFAGLRHFFKYGHNAQIHGVVAAVAVLLAFVLHFSPMEFVVLVLVIGLVWMAELFNTVIEKIMNHLSPAMHPEVKVIKDLAAAAVLVTAVVAVIAGVVLFGGKVMEMVRNSYQL